jgi:L-arabinokinase
VTVSTLGAALGPERTARAFPDADAFAARVRRHGLFHPQDPVVLARGPGRFDVLGGISDYAGGLVLGLPIREAAFAAAQAADDGRVVAVSGARRIAVAVGELLESPLDRLAARFAGEDGWAAYVLGPVALLAREEALSPGGLRLLVSSSVPEGKGLGSSAAVEVAVVSAVAGALGCSLTPRRIALLGQRAEQLVARAPCGAMDQMTAACGVADHVLALMCRPAEVLGSFPLPLGLTVWGIESGTRHAVRDRPYRRARCAAFMGKALLGLGSQYLAALRPADVDAAHLPERMSGADFLRLHAGVEDDLSSIEPGLTYPVRAATLHPVLEQVRVETFMRLLEEPLTTKSARALGELMAASHRSYSRCGLGTPATDRIVAAVRSAGWRSGLAGARASGGGGGGTVVVLGREEAEPVVRRLAVRLGAGVVCGSSPGAAFFGTRVV